MGNILSVYLKDLTETLRDRRSLIRMMLFSVLMLPTSGHLLLSYTNSYTEKARNEVLSYSILGAQYMPEIVDAFAAQQNMTFVEVSDVDELKQKIADDELQFGVAIPPEAQQLAQDGARVTVGLYFDSSSGSQKMRKTRAIEPIERLSEEKRSWRLTLLGVSSGVEKENIVEPVSYDEVPTATRRQEVGENIGGMVAYIVFLFCFMGCVFTASDLGAGEKERGTLETLLMLPVPRSHLILGKYFVVFTQGVMYSSLTLLSMAAWLMLESKGDSGVTDEILRWIGPRDLFLVWLMLVPIAAIFASILLSTSVYARSFREASSLSSLVNVLVICAVIIAILPGIELAGLWPYVPLTNVALAIKELIKGTMDYVLLLAILGSSTVIAGVFLVFCTRWFQRESVIFRE